jgi:hypothetical protein
MSRTAPALQYDTLLQASLATVRASPPGLVPLVLVLLLIPHVVVQQLAPAITNPQDIEQLWRVLPWTVPLLVADAFGAAAMAIQARAAWEGRATTAADIVAETLARWPTAIVTSLTFSALVFVGLTLFIVPGLVVACFFLLVVPAAVLEQLQFGKAMERSLRLTEGSRLTMLALIGLYLCVLFLGAGLFGGLVGTESFILDWVGVLLRAAWAILALLAGSTVVAVAFLWLRQNRRV